MTLPGDCGRPSGSGRSRPASTNGRGPSEAVGSVRLAALADGDAAIRRQSALALGNVGTEAASAVKGLRDHIGDADAGVRLQAAIALGKIDPQSRSRGRYRSCSEALARGSKGNRGGGEKAPSTGTWRWPWQRSAPVEPLLDALEKSNDEGTRAGVTFALVRMGARAKGAFKHLQGALQNRDAGVRQRSAEAMHAILPDPKEAVPVLVESLRHEDDYIRSWAARFLAELGAG